MMQVIPAPLENNLNSLLFQIKRLAPYYKTFQVDIADGIFVPNKTVQIDEIINFFTENQSLNTDKLMFDFHLMVKNYQAEIIKLQKLKKFIPVKNVFIHSVLNPDLMALNNKYPDFKYGLAINPVETIKIVSDKYKLDRLPFLQIMSVEPGFQGQPFIPDTLYKIEQLRQNNYRNSIYLDGAINEKSLPLITEPKNRPDFLCVGSYLTKTENLTERVNYLREALK